MSVCHRFTLKVARFGLWFAWAIEGLMKPTYCMRITSKGLSKLAGSKG